MHASTAQRIEINRKSRNQGFAFAGLHFSDLARVQHHPADQLDIEVPHIEDTSPGLANYRKCFFQDVVENLVQRLSTLRFDLLASVWIGVRFLANLAKTLLDTLPELVSFRTQLFIGELLHLRFERVNSRHARHHVLDFALVLGPKDLAQQSIDQSRVSFSDTSPKCMTKSLAH